MLSVTGRRPVAHFPMILLHGQAQCRFADSADLSIGQLSLQSFGASASTCRATTSSVAAGAASTLDVNDCYSGGGGGLRMCGSVWWVGAIRRTGKVSV